MPNVYNPSSPTAMGMEWLTNFFGSQDIVAVGAWAQRFRSRTAETINKLKLGFQTGSDANTDILLGEIITAGSEVPSGTVTTVQYQPNADIAVGAWLNQAGSGVNVFQSIDEGVDTVNLADYAKVAAHTVASNYDIRFGSAAFPATAHVLNVKIRVVGGPISPGSASFMTPFLLHRSSGSTYALTGNAPTAGTSFGTPTETHTYDLGEINPKTLLPWTPADIIGFDVGAVWAFRMQSWSSSSWEFRAYAVELDVTYRTVENRVAACSWVKGATGLSGGFDSAAFVALPGAGATWAKPVSGDFTLLLRKPNAPLYTTGSGTNWLLWFSGRLLAGVEQPHVIPGVVSATPTLDSYGQITVVDFTKTTKGRTIDVDIKTSAPADSNDSLPYIEALATITATNLARQQITPAASASYPIVRLDVSPGNATNPLIIKIKRNADNVQFGSTYTLQPSEARSFPSAGAFYEVQIVLTTPPALISGTKYYVELTTADASTSGWQMPACSSLFTGGDGAGFNGTTDQGDYNGSGFLASSDLPIVIAQTPAAPTNLVASVTTMQPANWAVAQSGCNIPSVALTRITWTKTSLGVNFGYYEIQRSEDHAATWATVDTIATEATQAWSDQEAPRGLGVQYRIRVQRSLDGAFSAWSAASAGVTAQPTGCEVIFCSNEAPTLLVAYNREPEARFSFLAATRDLFVQIYGADNVVAFMESEDAGVSFPMTLTVNFKDLPIDDTIGIFTPLQALARAGTSYVCVLDWTGNRWFAHVQLTEGDWTEPGHVYHAIVTVTTVSDTPSVAAQ